MLSVKNLYVNFGGIKALKGISFDVEEGKIVTLIGSNGAGKSTTLRSIMRTINYQEGEIFFNNENISKSATNEIVKKGIILCPEGRHIFPDMTVLENIKIGAYLRNDNISDDINYVYKLFPILKSRSWQLAGTLSGGEQQMLAIARALMGKPKLMMLDEPSLGLAPIIVNELFEIIKEINKNGITILLVEQNANVALKTADFAYVLNLGNIETSGKGKELLNNESIKKAYLGEKVN